jgi:hypothetical protein
VIPAGVGGCMKTIMRNLTGATLVAAAALGIGRPQGAAAQEIRLSDIRAQQPQETIYASAPCQRARKTPQDHIFQKYAINPRTFVHDLNTLMEKSDEVILAGTLDTATVISPSGESTATYDEVRVIRSWKGPHHAGDVLTFGRPGGLVVCKPGPDGFFLHVMPGGNKVDAPLHGSFVYVLFLKHAEGDEAQLVQGLLPAAGEGVQGIFWVHVPPPTHPCCDVERYCADVVQGSLQHCDSYLETSKSPVKVPYALDPLAKRYRGMPFSDFLREVQSVAGG